MARPRWLVKTLVFLERAFKRQLGMYPNDTSGKLVEQRAAGFLKELDRPQDSLRFQMTLEELTMQFDLFYDESALEPNARALQGRVIDLVPQGEAAHEIVEDMLRVAPCSSLLTAILCLNNALPVQALRIEFGEEIRVLGRGPTSWDEAMTIPKTLETPIRGNIVRLQHLGYERIRPHLRQLENLPVRVTVQWIDDNLVEFDFT